MLEEVSGLTEGQDFHLVFSPERVLTGRVFADLRKYPKLVGGLDRGGAAKRAVEFYEAVLDFDERPDLAAPQRRLGPRLAPRPPSWPSSPRPPTATSTSAWPTSSRGSPTQHGIDVHAGHRGLQLPALQPHPPPGHRRRRPLHPGLPAAVPLERPGGDGRARGPRGQRRHAGVRRRPARGRLRRPGRRAGRWCSAPPTAAASRRRRSPGVFPPVEALQGRAAPTASVHDPMYTDEELGKLGFEAYHLGEPVDAAVVQADHAEYRDLDARRPARREGHRRRPPGHRPGPLPGRHAPRHRSRAALST